MRHSGLLHWLVPVLGIAIGVFLADAAWWHRNSGVLASILKVPLSYAVLYYPSAWLFRACVFLHIAPGGNAAWTLYPWCIIAFWTVAGVLIGLWLVRGRARAIPAATRPGTSLDATCLMKELVQVRQDYLNALHVRPHPLRHRSELVEQARRLVEELPYFHSRLNQVASDAEQRL